MDLSSKLGKTQVVTAASTPSQQGGWYCETCKCGLKDSINYLDHINGKKHQRELGYSMRVERSTVTQVSNRSARVRCAIGFELLSRLHLKLTLDGSGVCIAYSGTEILECMHRPDYLSQRVQIVIDGTACPHPPSACLRSCLRMEVPAYWGVSRDCYCTGTLKLAYAETLMHRGLGHR